MALSIDTGLTYSLDNIVQQLNRYVSPAIFIFGVVGNTLNCLVLSQRTLRSNPCTLFLLVSSFIDIISILFGLPTRILGGWNLDPTTTITWICKIRAFTVFSTRTMATWLIMLATIDRWLLSSTDVHRRQICSMKNVKRAIILSLIVSVLTYVHMFYCYNANIEDQPLKCYGNTETCRLITDLSYAFISILIPLIIMVIFGLLTISNVHRIHTRVHHQITTILDNNERMKMKKKMLHSKKLDHHLLRMLSVEVILLIVLCVPQAIEKLYFTLKPFGSGSGVEESIKILMYNIGLLLAFIASGMPFYINVLAGGSVYTKACSDLIQIVIEKMFGKLQ
ncbi:unnamed protein product [Adineta steineri]|uniref:G-protein coupled receptors family 1 profile domain-containing protein n=1 Tax=Adineta steineri TaxID=433720 RepID=A0A814YIL4_9BILA|nr:unnamed protein product [Adineta steineri]CAF3905046.1 unnamed protein product [Adineta steineri]